MKLKSKKMSKSTFAVILMAIAMIAMLAFGGTYAYFTASATANLDEAKITTATIKLGANGKAKLSSTQELIVPKDEITLEATVNNGSDEEIWAFVAYSLKDAPATAELKLKAEGGISEGWALVSGTKNVYAKRFAVSENVAFEAIFTYDDTLNSVNGADVVGMGTEITAEVEFAATQYRHLEDVADAYAAAVAASLLTSAESAA